MSNRNENSSDVIVKLVVFLGAIAAIAVAAMLLYKKFYKPAVCEGDRLNFDDEDFCDDFDCCCDCDDCVMAEEVEEAEEAPEETAE